MTFRLYDFKCPNGHVTEELVPKNIKDIMCPECSKDAHRIISPTKFSLDPLSFPTAGDKWIREHEKAGRSNGRNS